MSTTSSSYNTCYRIAILMGALFLSSETVQGIEPNSSSQDNQTGTDSERKTQTTNDGIPLEKGKPIEREIAGGQTDLYLLSLTQGQYARVVVEQKGADV